MNSKINNTTSISLNIKRLCVLLIFSFILSTVQAAENEKQLNKSVPTVEEVKRNIDPVTYTKGRRLFMQNCARCHGRQAEGAEHWQRPDKEGKNRPPPLNGTAHSWHHSPESLMNTIKNGAGKIGGNMPAWKGKLTDSEIKLILSWIQAQWPDEIYTAWYNRFHQK